VSYHVPTQHFRLTARRRGIPFELTIEEAWYLFVAQNRRCALSGLELKMPVGTLNGTALTEIDSPSLDRIDSKKPYVVVNVQWVHKHINIMKNSFNQSEFIALCHAVAKNHADPESSSLNGPAHRWSGGRKGMPRPSRSVWSPPVTKNVQRPGSSDPPSSRRLAWRTRST
jgi:hypothetical protein